METLSPMDSGGDSQHPAGSTYGSGESNAPKSPLHMNLGFLKSLTEKKNTTRGMIEYDDIETRPNVQVRWTATKT